MDNITHIRTLSNKHLPSFQKKKKSVREPQSVFNRSNSTIFLERIFFKTHTCARTHTHTNIYIYMCVCMCEFVLKLIGPQKDENSFKNDIFSSYTCFQVLAFFR